MGKNRHKIRKNNNKKLTKSKKTNKKQKTKKNKKTKNKQKKNKKKQKKTTLDFISFFLYSFSFPLNYLPSSIVFLLHLFSHLLLSELGRILVVSSGKTLIRHRIDVPST
jgi:hypothetical protein